MCVKVIDSSNLHVYLFVPEIWFIVEKNKFAILALSVGKYFEYQESGIDFF